MPNDDGAHAKGVLSATDLPDFGITNPWETIVVGGVEKRTTLLQTLLPGGSTR